MEIFNIKLQYYIICWGGALVLYFKLKNENKEVFKFLPHINYKWENQPFVILIDMFMFTIFGAFIGTIFTQPTNYQQSLAAGLGWTGFLSSTTSKNSPKEIPERSDNNAPKLNTKQRKTI